MKVVGIYSFNGGMEVVETGYHKQYEEVIDAISNVISEDHQTKSSREKTMPGRMLFSPVSLNKAFKEILIPRGWESKKVPAVYSDKFYVGEYSPSRTSRGAYREIDFIKDGLGLEIQFGKYAFMVYNVCAKMTIFHNLGFIDTGIELVPVKGFADHMSTGVSYFEQFVWDLEHRGVADIDIPVLILGIDI